MMNLINKIKELSSLSYSQLAECIGYSSPQRVYDIARGMRDPRGPAVNAINYFSQAFLDEKMKSIVPRFIIADNETGGPEIIMSLQYPRFLGFIVEEDLEIDGDEVTTTSGEKIVVGIWIDNPLDKSESVLKDAAQFVNRYTQQSS